MRLSSSTKNIRMHPIESSTMFDVCAAATTTVASLFYLSLPSNKLAVFIATVSIALCVTAIVVS